MMTVAMNLWTAMQWFQRVGLWGRIVKIMQTHNPTLHSNPWRMAQLGIYQIKDREENSCNKQYSLLEPKLHFSGVWEIDFVNQWIVWLNLLKPIKLWHIQIIALLIFVLCLFISCTFIQILCDISFKSSPKIENWKIISIVWYKNRVHQKTW